MASSILLSAALLLGYCGSATAGQPSGGPCNFTLSSTGLVAGPAGELPDGQIRLNGSYPKETYSITNGGITDSMGFGCIITGEDCELDLCIPEQKFADTLHRSPHYSNSMQPGSFSPARFFHRREEQPPLQWLGDFLRLSRYRH